MFNHDDTCDKGNRHFKVPILSGTVDNPYHEERYDFSVLRNTVGIGCACSQLKHLKRTVLFTRRTTP